MEENPNTLSPEPLSSSDEHTWAMLAHLSVLTNLVTGFLGPVAALVIYLVFKDRSRFVAYHSMQPCLPAHRVDWRWGARWRCLGIHGYYLNRIDWTVVYPSVLRDQLDTIGCIDLWHYWRRTGQPGTGFPLLVSWRLGSC
jgi:hypothetical protein